MAFPTDTDTQIDGVLADPDRTSPPAEPPSGNDTIDAESGEPAGGWYAIPGSLGQQVASGRISLADGLALAAANDVGVEHCSARISKKVGGVRAVYDDGGVAYRQRHYIWTVSHVCAGTAPAMAFDGHSDLMARNGDWLLSYGEFYSAGLGSAAGTIRYSHRDSAYSLGRRVGGKRIRWFAKLTVPPPYQWGQADPTPDLHGIDDHKSSCRLESDGSYPAYLNRINCTLWSTRFR